MLGWGALSSLLSSRGDDVQTQPELTFQGYDGATSLKAEISGRIKTLNDASSFREARELLLKLGGAEALERELVFAGFVDPETHMLRLVEKPFNIFAHLAGKKMIQPSTVKEQEALGKYKDKYHICANKAELDLHWDSQDPKWLSKASMARRHRFLTTKDLHWQWFNALTFGLVSPEHGGLAPRDAVVVVEEIKAAALLYAKNIGGWSENVGIFVNVFGHNNVNSLFVHVLDMSEVGPGFELHAHKNCPLDAVLKVLREEAVQNLLPSPPRSITLLPGLKDTKTAAFFFQGTNGATSLKAELVERIPQLKDASGYREARRILNEELGGWESVFEELRRSGFVDPESHELTTGTAPFNVFARIAAGKMVQPGSEAEQKCLGDYASKFMICSNRPENDEHWDSNNAEWVGKASMARQHKFLIVKNLHWTWFNAVGLGLVPEEQGGVKLNVVVATLELMKAAALTYAANKGGWSNKVGLFFHIFGHNSVNSLHLHVLDMEELGPTFWALEFKNCPLDAVLRVLKEELSSQEIAGANSAVSEASKGAAKAAAEAAASAKETMEAVEQMVKRHSQQLAGGITSSNLCSNGSDDPDAGDVLRLNIGGEFVDVPRDTMLLAPQGSMLRAMFSGESKRPMVQREGRIFLNYPPASFKRIVNYLRLLESTHPSDTIRPILDDSLCRDELEELAWLLGVQDFILEPQCGRGQDMPKRIGRRPELADIRSRNKKAACTIA